MHTYGNPLVVTGYQVKDKGGVIYEGPDKERAIAEFKRHNNCRMFAVGHYRDNCYQTGGFLLNERGG